MDRWFILYIAATVLLRSACCHATPIQTPSGFTRTASTPSHFLPPPPPPPPPLLPTQSYEKTCSGALHVRWTNDDAEAATAVSSDVDLLPVSPELQRLQAENDPFVPVLVSPPTSSSSISSSSFDAARSTAAAAAAAAATTTSLVRSQWTGLERPVATTSTATANGAASLAIAAERTDPQLGHWLRKRRNDAFRAITVQPEIKSLFTLPVKTDVYAPFSFAKGADATQFYREMNHFVRHEKRSRSNRRADKTRLPFWDVLELPAGGPGAGVRQKREVLRFLPGVDTVAAGSHVVILFAGQDAVVDEIAQRVIALRRVDAYRGVTVFAIRAAPMPITFSAKKSDPIPEADAHNFLHGTDAAHRVHRLFVYGHIPLGAHVELYAWGYGALALVHTLYSFAEFGDVRGRGHHVFDAVVLEDPPRDGTLFLESMEALLSCSANWHRFFELLLPGQTIGFDPKMDRWAWLAELKTLNKDGGLRSSHLLLQRFYGATSSEFYPIPVATIMTANGKAGLTLKDSFCAADGEVSKAQKNVALSMDIAAGEDVLYQSPAWAAFMELWSSFARYPMSDVAPMALRPFLGVTSQTKQRPLFELPSETDDDASLLSTTDEEDLE